MHSQHDVIRQAYRAFNERNLEAALRMMDPDVDWPNAWEGGRVRGHAAVRDYWTRQWQALDPKVTPISIRDEDGQLVVDVDQVVRDPAGTIVLDRVVQHVFTLRNGLIQRMEIREE